MTEPKPAYLIDWVGFEEKHPKAFSLAAQCDDVIVWVEGPVYQRCPNNEDNVCQLMAVFYPSGAQCQLCGSEGYVEVSPKLTKDEASPEGGDDADQDNSLGMRSLPQELQDLRRSKILRGDLQPDSLLDPPLDPS